MQKGRRVLIALFVLMALGMTGRLLFHHFVTDQITDKGGMINPDYVAGTEDIYIHDGDHTYVDNEKLLQMITGVWSSEDSHYTLKLDNDYHIILSLDSEQLLDTQIQFAYLQPGTAQSTEFSLDSCILQKEDGASAGEITSFYHTTSEGDPSGRLIMEIDLAGNSKIVEFNKGGNENE